MKKAFYTGALPALAAAALLAGCASTGAAQGDDGAPAAPDTTAASGSDSSAYKDTWFGGGYATLSAESAAVCDVIFRSDGTCTMTLSESPGSGTFSQDGTYDEDAAAFTFKPNEDTHPSILGYEPGYTFIKYRDVLLMESEGDLYASYDGGATIENDYRLSTVYAFGADGTYDYSIDGDSIYGGEYTELAPGIIVFENPGERGGVMASHFAFVAEDAERSRWQRYHCYSMWQREEE